MTETAQKLGIIADDLTGACDAGVEFVARGFSCVVSLDGLGEDHADVRVISTETRASTAVDAEIAVTNACAQMMRDGVRVVYKKIDSTMRGNCRAEIDAAMQALQVKRAFVAPAFPEMDRTVIAGWLSVDNDPAQSVHLPSALGEIGVRCLSVRRPYPDLSRESGLFVVDASTREELRAFARHYRDDLQGSLVAGSAGLAGEIAQLLSGACSKTECLQEARVARPVLLLAGSSHKSTLAQITFLSEKRNVPTVSLMPGWERSAQRFLHAGRDVILAFEAASSSERELVGIRELVGEKHAAALLLTGGYTARMVCSVLGARAIKLWRTILPGVPIGNLVGGIGHGLPVITKSGGFGKSNLLDTVLQSRSGATIQ